MFLLLQLMLVASFNAFALEWKDLETNQEVVLKQVIQLQQIERSSSFVDLTIGEKFELDEIIGLDYINVTIFKFKYFNCSGNHLVTDLGIIPVKNTSPMVEVGAKLENCSLEVFVENRDLMTQSLFE